MKLFISIVIPIYNRPFSIIKTLDSIKKQKPNYEVIIVDDSTDTTSYEIKKYIDENNYLKIKHIKCESISNKSVPNIGLNGSNGANKNRNIGIINSLGEIIVFLDSDDELLEGALEDIEEAFKKNKNLVLYLGSVKYISGFKKKYTNLLYGKYIEYLRTYWKQGEILPAVRKKILLENNLNFEDDLACFENILYLDLLKFGGEFYRSKKLVRKYDDTKKDRLTFILPRTNFRNMRNGYIRNLKKNFIPLMFYSPIVFFSNLIKIIIYNRLINRKKFFTLVNLLTILTLPLPRNLILQSKNFYDYKNNLFGLNKK